MDEGGRGGTGAAGMPVRASASRAEKRRIAWQGKPSRRTDRRRDPARRRASFEVRARRNQRREGSAFPVPPAIAVGLRRHRFEEQPARVVGGVCPTILNGPAAAVLKRRELATHIVGRTVHSLTGGSSRVASSAPLCSSNSGSMMSARTAAASSVRLPEARSTETRLPLSPPRLSSIASLPSPSSPNIRELRSETKAGSSLNSLGPAEIEPEIGRRAVRCRRPPMRMLKSGIGNDIYIIVLVTKYFRALPGSQIDAVDIAIAAIADIHADEDFTGSGASRP